MRQLLNKLLSPRLQLSPTCLIRLSADSSLLLLSRLSCPDSDSVGSVTRPEGWERKGDIFYLFCFPGLGCTLVKLVHQHISPLWSDWREGGPGLATRCSARLAPQLFRHHSYSLSLKMKVVETKEVVTPDQWIKSPATSDWMTFQGSAALCCWHYEASCLLEDERGFTPSHPSKQQAVEMERWTRVKLLKVAKKVSGNGICPAVFPIMWVLKVHFFFKTKYKRISNLRLQRWICFWKTNKKQIFIIALLLVFLKQIYFCFLNRFQTIWVEFNTWEL